MVLATETFHRITKWNTRKLAFLSVLLQKVLQKIQKRSFSSLVPTISALSKSLILIGGHGNRKDNFLKKQIRNPLRSHNLFALMFVVFQLHKLWILLLLTVWSSCYDCVWKLKSINSWFRWAIKDHWSSGLCPDHILQHINIIFSQLCFKFQILCWNQDLQQKVCSLLWSLLMYSKTQSPTHG